MVLKTQERSVEHGAPASLLAAGLAALGIVYGDIGTSPLYAFKIAAETVAGGGTIGTDPAPVLGVLSLIVWSLLIVIALKYVVFVNRSQLDVRHILPHAQHGGDHLNGLPCDYGISRALEAGFQAATD